MVITLNLLTQYAKLVIPLASTALVHITTIAYPAKMLIW